jgi:hypothetical protein
MVRLIAEKMSGRKDESEVSSGMLYSTGLVAGGSIGGVLIAVLTVIFLPDGRSLLETINLHGRITGAWTALQGPLGDLIAVGVFGFLCWLLLRAARRKVEGLGQ